MKCTWCYSRLDNSNGWGERPVESALQVFCRYRGSKRKTCHLAERMNAGIGAPRALGQGRFPANPPQRRLQFSLDGSFSRLHLPAAEIRAVVGQGQLPGLERGLGLGGFDHGNNC